MMKPFDGYMKGMGIGGWLTNFKRIRLLPPEWRFVLTPGDFEHFENYIMREDVKRIAGFGMDHIRLAFDQIVFEDYDNPFTYRESSFGYIDKFLEWCDKEKINVILNLHKAVGNYCDFTEANSLMKDDGLQQRFIELWLQFEKRYHDLDMPFELLNELTDRDNSDWNKLAIRTIKEIRKLNPKRKIIIGGGRWNSVDCLKELHVFDDDNVIYTFHFYTLHEFTHQRSILNRNVAIYNREMPYPGDMERYRDSRRFLGEEMGDLDMYERFDYTYLRDHFQPAIDFLNSNPGKHLYLGEFGTIRHCPLQYRENWMRDLIYLAQMSGIAYSVWNYLSTPYDGNRFSLVDDDRRQMVSERMLRIIRGEEPIK